MKQRRPNKIVINAMYFGFLVVTARYISTTYACVGKHRTSRVRIGLCKSMIKLQTLSSVKAKRETDNFAPKNATEHDICSPLRCSKAVNEIFNWLPNTILTPSATKRRTATTNMAITSEKTPLRRKTC